MKTINYINIFKNEINNKHFFDFGYFIESVLTIEEVKDLCDYLSKIDIKYKKGFNISFSNDNAEIRQNVDEYIKGKLKDKIDILAENYIIYCAGLALKKSGNDSYFFLHTDDSLCNEDLNIPFSIWIPLVDVDIHNGCLAVVPCSHKYTGVYRSTPLKEPLLKYEADILKNCMIDVKIKAGQAVIFHPSLLHYSYNNLSGMDRAALIIACLPEKAEPIIVYNKKKFIFDRFYFYTLTKDMLYTWDWKSEPNTIQRERIFPNKNPPNIDLFNILKNEINNIKDK